MTILLETINKIVMYIMRSHYRTTMYFASIGEHSSRSFTCLQNWEASHWDR